MVLLDYVNMILPTVGERPVTSINTKHPTLATLLPILNHNRRTALKKNGGWWFNKFDTTLYPDADGEITVGSDCLAFVADRGNVAVRGSRLFNGSTANYKFDGPVQGTLTQDVEFDEMPDSVKDYVFASSVVQNYVTDLGVTQELNEYKMLAASAWSTMLAEHLRQVKHNTRKSKHWQRYTAALRS